MKNKFASGKKTGGTMRRESFVRTDRVPPVVSSVRLSPAKTSYQTGEAVTINWRSSDNVAVLSHELRYLRMRDGGSVEVIAAGLRGTEKSYHWTIPNEMRSAGAVWVVASDGANVGGLKSTPFAINPAPGLERKRKN